MEEFELKDDEIHPRDLLGGRDFIVIPELVMTRADLPDGAKLLYGTIDQWVRKTGELPTAAQLAERGGMSENEILGYMDYLERRPLLPSRQEYGTTAWIEGNEETP